MISIANLTGSLFVRVMVLVMASMAALALTITLVLQTPLAFRLFPQGLGDNAEALAELVWLLESTPAEAEPVILSTFSGAGRAAVIRSEFPSGAAPRAELAERLVSSSPLGEATLAERTILFQTLNARGLRRDRADGGASVTALAALQLAVRLDDGRVLEVKYAPAAFATGRPRLIAGMIAFVTGLVSFFGIIALARAFQPLRHLQRSAERFGETGAPHPAAETGPVEVRRTARALNRMQARVSALVQERGRMVAAVAHDVRTTATRIRLRLNGGGRLDTAAVERDLDQMEDLISNMLAYARSEDPEAPRSVINLVEFCRRYAEGRPDAPSVTIDPPDSAFTLPADPVALNRMLDNCFENARAYAGGASAFKLGLSLEGLQISIEDDGPGVDEADLEVLFEPFARGERSRSRETGGAGLGLGITRSLARAHGATFRLERRAEGGMAAVFKFPHELAVD